MPHFISYDYFIEAVKLLSDGQEIKRQDVTCSPHAFKLTSPLLNNGLVAVRFHRPVNDPDAKRTAHYQLTRPYSDICVRDIAQNVSVVTHYDVSLYRLTGPLRLTEIDGLTVPEPTTPYSDYSSNKLLSMLFLLRSDTYTPYSDILGKAYTGRIAGKMLSDMREIGVVVNLYGRGYRLCRSLTDVTIGELLPYLCSNSRRKREYNRLFYALKDRPVSDLRLTHK